MRRKTFGGVRFGPPFLPSWGIPVFFFKTSPRPYIAELQHGDQFKQLAFDCDMAMHEEAALRELTGSDPETVRLKLSADVGMLVCHEYDKLRKELLIQGLSEDQLAMLGLQVLEVEQITVQQMVDAHRMDRF